jgi:phage shock protein A
MGPLLDELLVVLRVGVLWVGLPLLLVALAVGPGRCWGAVKRGWRWLWRKRLDPEEVLGQVVKQYQDLVASLNRTVAKSRQAEDELRRHIKQSEDNLVALEGAAAKAAAAHDDLEAKAVLYRINLERSALDTFRGQLERQKKQTEDLRKNLYMGEMQLRQYEVGRSILLSQLAEAETAEQQYAIASQFDPFSTVASWKQAENLVEEKQLNARAVERVYADLMGVAPGAVTAEAPPPPPPEALEEQLRRLKERLRQAQ